MWRVYRRIASIQEEVLDWSLLETTDYILAETVFALQRYHTEHGRGNNATYCIILEIGWKMAPDGFEIYPLFGTTYE
jgi:hypothetical protein